MSDAVRDAIAASIALETRIVSQPVEPYGYGSDVWCDTDVDPGVRELAGSDRIVLAQAILRRLDTPRGSLPDDPDYGIALRSMLSTGTTAADVRRMAGQIHNEVTKDDRIDTLRVTVTPTPTGDALDITLVVTPVDSGPFTMVLAVTSGATLLEAIT